ncbi:PREDICTED: general transcription factor 3C polypeptide 3 [Bactrocera latifrons]|uniref:General transcription factor 3C polypeptide 3 n=1 Tax=Bactrocera latifrons TaxID=174628 RepID=A0A0K8WG98_BACLA|nr:PREDICTED: general transcription factor 3C polypeptide 3 [Bactrocera latifrons]
MDGNAFLIEELSSNDVSESELSEFKETQPLKVLDIIAPDDYKPTSSTNICGSDAVPLATHSESSNVIGGEGEAALIKRFVSGEVEFPDCYTKLEPGEEEEYDVDKFELEAQEQQKYITDVEQSTSQQASAKRRNDYAVMEHKTVDTDLSEPNWRSGTESTGSSSGPNTPRRRTVLNAALQGLMGEANLSFARGQIDIAEKICLEIIRQNPLAPEPFFTLAEIYETRNTEKHLYFLTLAAHLNPHDRDLWIRISELHIAQGNLQRARIFYTKAIKAMPRDYDLRLRKARLLELMNETQRAMLTYLKMLPHVPRTESELCLTTAKNVAHHFHGISKHAIALEAMESAYQICGDRFTLEDLNLYMDLLIFNKGYAKVLRCLRARTSLELETEQERNLELIFFCVIPDDFVPDFRAKLCVSLIHLHAHHLLGYLIQNVHEHIPLTDDRLDLYIDIAEALMQEHKYAEAIELLRPITDGDTIECPAFVWLRQAECLRNLNRTNEAIESYTRVVELAPFCYEAKFTLSALLKQQGRHLEAVKALEQSGECDGQPLNARLLYERCVMLQQIGEIEEFLEVGYVLLARHSIKLRNRDEMLAAANGGSFYNAEGLKVILQMRNITEDTDKALQEYLKIPQENSDLTIQDEFRLFLELIRVAYEQRKFSCIERICFGMVTTKRFTAYHIELERIIILACYFNDNCAIAFSYLRELISKSPHNIALWNLLSLLVQKGQDLRYHRYVRRLIQRHPTERQLRIFLAHYHLFCCSYKYALNIYVPLFKEQQTPIHALCIAVIFNQLSLQRKVLRKTAAVAQSIAFAQKYATLRAGVEWKVGSTTTGTVAEASSLVKETNATCRAVEQEICYNFGRIYQQAGLVHLALEYYERGLAAQHPLIEENEEYLGLRQEIAYNLHLIYKASGNLRKARQYLYEYCVV